MRQSGELNNLKWLPFRSAALRPGGGPIHSEAGLSVPKRACQSRGGPASPEAGLSVPRRAYHIATPLLPGAGCESCPPRGECCRSENCRSGSCRSGSCRSLSCRSGSCPPGGEKAQKREEELSPPSSENTTIGVGPSPGIWRGLHGFSGGNRKLNRHWAQSWVGRGVFPVRAPRGRCH